jgi:HlyD family secretion protein
VNHLSDPAACAGPTLPDATTAHTPFATLRGVAFAGNLLFCGYVLGLGTWSIFAPLESAAVASGVVEAESSRKTLQHLEGGIVREIMVADGDIVVAGQPLIRLDSTKLQTEARSLKGQLWDAKAREVRLLSERNGAEELRFSDEFAAAIDEDPSLAAVVAGQRDIFDARRQVLLSQARVVGEKILQVEKEIAGLTAQELATSKRAEIARQEVGAVQTLVDKGLERRPRLLALERETADIHGRRGELAAQISRAHQVISESRAMLLKLESDRQNEIAQLLRDTQGQILLLSERLQAVEDQLSRAEVRAPEAGIVTELRVHTPGGVIGPGAAIMDLVPRHDRLIVTARVRAEDIDVVRPGLNADIHLLAYNERRVPALKGVVTYISADRLLDRRTDQPYYATKIRVDDKQPVELDAAQMVPGMPTRVLIKTGRSTVAIYALKPLLDSFNNAFRED